MCTDTTCRCGGACGGPDAGDCAGTCAGTCGDASMDIARARQADAPRTRRIELSPPPARLHSPRLREAAARAVGTRQPAPVAQPVAAPARPLPIAGPADIPPDTSFGCDGRPRGPSIPLTIHGMTLRPPRSRPGTGRLPAALLPGIGPLPLRRGADGHLHVDGNAIAARRDDRRRAGLLTTRRNARAGAVTLRPPADGTTMRLRGTRGRATLRSADPVGDAPTLDRDTLTPVTDSGSDHITLDGPSLDPDARTPFGDGSPPDRDLPSIDRDDLSAIGTTEFVYRATSFSVPSAWLVDYLDDLDVLNSLDDVTEGYGKVSGTAAALDALWPEFRAAAAATGIDSTMYYGMLGCYNLPRGDILDEEPARFFSSGWGPPYKTYLFTNLLIASFHGHIQQVCTAVPDCDDFSSFVGLVLRGIPVRNVEDLGPCVPTFHFRNSDIDNAYFVPDGGRSIVPACTDAEISYACDDGFLPVASSSAAANPGLDWSKAFPLTMGPDDYLVAPDPTFPLGRPNVGRPIAYVADGTMSVTQHPALLAFDGYSIDFILYLARMALDYARDPEVGLGDSAADDFRQAASELARYALRILVDRGRLLIHELGHAWLGGGHCSHDCCFDLSAARWECAVTALLGLPIEWGSTVDATWDRTLAAVGCNDTLGVATYACTLDAPGEVGGQAFFSCRGCAATAPLGLERVP